MSVNCINCVAAKRTGVDLLCDACRVARSGRWWVSWHQPTDDHRPLTDPPHPAVLGWWCSGYDADDVAVLCALVEAGSPEEAKVYVGISWPEAGRWRFAERRTMDWRPSDRFPLKPWMRERMDDVTTA